MRPRREYKIALERLIKEHGKVSWEGWDYKIDFKELVLCWGKRKLVLTYGEACYLYERFILNKRPCNMINPQVLYTMRRKHGDKFMEEIFQKNKSHEIGGNNNRVPRKWKEYW